MNTKTTKKELIESLWQFISENKQNKMKEVIENRTRHVTVVLEDIFQQHNASAILRSCDIFGVQDIHVVEDRYTFKAVSTVAMGSPKWLDIHRYTSVKQSFDALRAQGYKIVATTPHTNSYELPTLPIDQKMAFVFGSEQTGLSDVALENADMFVKIPMYGFVESFNVSVSVALCLYDVMTRLHNSHIAWQMPESEKEEVLLEWMKRVSKTAELLQVREE